MVPFAKHSDSSFQDRSDSSYQNVDLDVSHSVEASNVHIVEIPHPHQKLFPMLTPDKGDQVTYLKAKLPVTQPLRTATTSELIEDSNSFHQTISTSQDNFLPTAVTVALPKIKQNEIKVTNERRRDGSYSGHSNRINSAVTLGSNYVGSRNPYSSSKAPSFHIGLQGMTLKPNYSRPNPKQKLSDRYHQAYHTRPSYNSHRHYSNDRGDYVYKYNYSPVTSSKQLSTSRPPYIRASSLRQRYKPPPPQRYKPQSQHPDDMASQQQQHVMSFETATSSSGYHNVLHEQSSGGEYSDHDHQYGDSVNYQGDTNNYNDDHIDHYDDHHHHHHHHTETSSGDQTHNSDRLGLNIGLGIPKGITLQIGGLKNFFPLGPLGLIRGLITSLIPKPQLDLSKRLFFGLELGHGLGLGKKGGILNVFN